MVLSYSALLITKSEALYATPTIEAIDPPAPIIGLTLAPTNGAYPNPFTVLPIDIGTPPLGNSLVLILFDMKGFPSADVIPVNITVVTPEAPVPLSTILKFLLGLNSVEGDWNIPLINKIPLPPVVPNPTVFAPPTFRTKSDLIPVN